MATALTTSLPPIQIFTCLAHIGALECRPLSRLAGKLAI